MTPDQNGIWVRLIVEGDSTISGFVPGADAPNDFWTTFKSQLIRVETATEELATGKCVDHGTIYVNRDRIILVKLWDGPPQ